MILQFDSSNFIQLCDRLGKKDEDLKGILKKCGYPPMWKRSSSFSTLIHIILEQQVSLASAMAALNKLKKTIGIITPKKLLSLTDSELKNCYFSRQKIIYARLLAESILARELDLKKMKLEEDQVIREKLTKIKGIGDWTVDIYLLMSLQRTDIFPSGDLAMIKSMKEVKKLSPVISRKEIIESAEHWRPYRSIATMLLWHHYLNKSKM